MATRATTRFFWLALSLVAGAALAAEAEKPITTLPGEAGDLLRKWQVEGTACGNAGDHYDNRDRGHSMLNLTQFPQLIRAPYTDDQKKPAGANWDWALQEQLMPFVVFGNSSTASGWRVGGSNSRMCYDVPAGLALLYQHYIHNNVYFYPEFQDHDAWTDSELGLGLGDLFAVNTPYLITSQGQSGTDQPFMRCYPLTMAAFRPDVKKKLVESGLLMPTIQMILRICNNHLTNPDEYLTGKAHPSVFEGAWVNDAKMVRLAHEITADNVPPMVQMSVVEEDEPVCGREFFEANGNEKLCDTPCVIARIFRSKNYVRRMVVCATKSFDLNNRPLTYKWVVLRGDPAKIAIKPRNEAGSEVELLVQYPERRKVDADSNPLHYTQEGHPGWPLVSNRVDIGLFVNNGAYWSAPGFVTFYSLNTEARTYDDAHRILEIGYQMGVTRFNIANWTKLFAQLNAGTPASAVFKRYSSDGDADVLRLAAEQYAKSVQPPLERAEAELKAANAARKKLPPVDLKAAEQKVAAARSDFAKSPDASAKAARDAAEAEYFKTAEPYRSADAAISAAQGHVDSATQELSDFVNNWRPGLVKESLQVHIFRMLRRAARDPNFWPLNSATLEQAFQDAASARQKAVSAARTKLVRYGMIKDVPGNALEVTPIRAESVPAAERLTRYELALLERWQSEILLTLLLPGVASSNYDVNYVEPQLNESPAWRDVYKYSPKGESAGWTRYGGEKPQEFNPEGLLVLEKDNEGRCVRGRTVTYDYESAPKDVWPYWRATKTLPGNEIDTIDYASPDDWMGKVVNRESAASK